MQNILSATQSLPCLLECELRGGRRGGEEDGDECRQTCERWRKVRESFQYLISPAVPFDKLANAIFLQKARGSSEEIGDPPPCFLECPEIADKKNKRPAIPSEECQKKCDTWEKVKTALAVISREVSFELFKDYLIQIHLAIGTEISEVIFIQLFTPPEEERTFEPSHIAILPSDSSLKSRLNYPQSDHIDRLTGYIRYLLASSLLALLLAIYLLFQRLMFIPQNRLSEFAYALLSKPLVPLLFCIVFVIYVFIIHYFLARMSRELRNWRRDFTIMNELLQNRSNILARLNERLRRIDEIRARMVHVASHDLKAPLAAIEGYLNVMLGGYYGDVTEKQGEAIIRAIRRAEGMREFIDEILDVATIEKEGLKRELAPLDVTPLVEQLYEDFEILADDRKIELKFDYPKKIPEIVASKHRFIQVLQNLVSNAIKFTPNGGMVSVTVLPREDDVMFSVSDTGPGIAKEDIENIFTEFYRIRKSGEDDIQGTGLGLFIVKSIVSAHGGKIWAESEPGKGSVFHFTMKRAK
ncbi:MAG: hypothetical protein Kow0090_00670 [Myxococcota bacterium]